jgi:hypothetical protein
MTSFEPRLILTHWRTPLGELPTPDDIRRLSDPNAACPLPKPEERTRTAVRALLREGGFAPSGRNKPCSEYIASAARDNRFPAVNPAVDIANAVALHSGLPTGVLDAELLRRPVRFVIAHHDARYVFNPSGQELALGGLWVLADAEGPCASPVKDPMRTKTRPETTLTLTILYGTTQLPGLVDEATAWTMELHQQAGGEPRGVELAELNPV